MYSTICVKDPSFKQAVRSVQFLAEDCKKRGWIPVKGVRVSRYPNEDGFSARQLLKKPD